MDENRKTSKRTIAILFDNLGPYHLARLAGAESVLDVLAIEFGGNSVEYAWERADAGKSLKIATLFPGQSSRQVSTPEFKDALYRALQGFQPEAVAIPGWSGRGAFLALDWCLQNRVPAIVMSESTAHDEVRSGWREWIKRRYVSLCSAALVGGTPHRDYMIQLGMAPERISLGYDAVDNCYFASKVAELRNGDCGMRNEYKLPENYFLASARFIPKKNLSRLIDAYARYRTAFTERTARSAVPTDPWDLVILGDGELRSALEAQLTALNLQAHVQMPGFKQYPDLPAYYGLAGAFVHASTTEQWGLVVNEAMASGLPVLVSNRCGCAADLVQNGVNGFTFDPENVEQLADLMLKLSTFTPSHLSTISVASQRIIAEWGPDRFASGLMEAVNHALTLPLRKAGLLNHLLLSLLQKK